MTDQPAETAPETSPQLPAAAESPAPVASLAPQRPIEQSPNRGFFWGTGRRKTAVASVRLRPGAGELIIDKRKLDDYFFELRDREDVLAPLKATKSLGKYDVFVRVRGGGQTGQAQAIMLGIARALLKADTAHEPTLRDGRYLTRDSREVERKKPGRPGARKRFQFSKR